ncbi:MAG: glycerophosphodiester phosphodiesterase family protein [Gammaproteobacteria bacterium]
MTIPHLVAHRGQMEHYPENTLVSLEAALECGAKYIEFDVQSTVDGQLVVFHDSELKRTTGVTGNLLEMSLQDLESIRAHEPARFSLAFFNQHIPTLSDVIGLLQQYPKASAFVEIKEESLQHFGTDQVMANLLKQLEIVHQQCVIISFEADAIAYVRQHSDFPCGWVLYEYDDKSLIQAQQLKPDYLIVNHRKIPSNQEPLAGDWHWMVYDITDPELALHYASFNILLIESRDICTLLEHPLLALNSINHDL